MEQGFGMFAPWGYNGPDALECLCRSRAPNPARFGEFREHSETFGNAQIREVDIMANGFTIVQSIAEQRIVEAQKRGFFDNLPGKGRPLELEDTSTIPEELRMAWHVLKNANMVPPEVAERKEIATLSDMLDKESDEHRKLAGMRRLEALVFLAKNRAGRNLAVHAADEAYLDRILEKTRPLKELEKGKRSSSGA